MLDVDPPGTGEEETRRRPLLAPWWHTVLIIGTVFAVSLLGFQRRSAHSIAQHHVREYVATIAWEWALLALTLAGLFLRSRISGVRAWLRTWLGGHQWLSDLRAALLFWLASTFVLGAVGMLLKVTGLGTPEQVLSELAPRDSVELALFLLLSLTAGLCEELIFRGYLLEQCTRVVQLRRANVRDWTGALLSSLVFGAAHLYEGASGVIAITLFGLMFAWLALRRRSVRAGMMAHAWHDAVSGIALFLLTRAHAV